jgi:two-component system cell cycle sensor histidine kinase/response regulator CckA
MSKDEKVVLIVEDEKDLLDSYADIITAADYKSIKAPDGYKGLEVLATHKDLISLVILDMMMLGMDGLEFLKSVNKDEAKYGRHPIIALSNMTSDLVVKEAIKLGVSSYLKKTETNARQLIDEINRILQDK